MNISKRCQHLVTHRVHTGTWERTPIPVDVEWGLVIFTDDNVTIQCDTCPASQVRVEIIEAEI